MNIKTVKVGSLQTNCYILANNNECLIIDPGDDYDRIINEIRDKKLMGILLTHNHFDHVGALKQLIDNYEVPVYDKQNLEEKKYDISSFNFQVIYNPGHTNDSVSFYFTNEKIMFTGDFLFNGSIGRTDLPTGNHLKMLESLKKIRGYDASIKIYPGHGPASNLGWEFNNNIFLKDNLD